MLLSIETARISLSRYWWSLGGLNAMAVAVFLFPLFRGTIPTQDILIAMGAAACIGLIVGLRLTYRSSFDSTYSLWAIFYGLIAFEFLLCGGCSALALAIADRSDLRWIAVYINSFVMLLTLIAGMHREARTLEFWGNVSDRWKKKLAKYLNYSSYQVSPSLTADFPLKTKTKVPSFQSSMWIVAIGSVNIPLLFELYAGGRANAIFFAAPVMAGTLAYVNLKTLGPGFTRLLMLREIEKAAGRRFVNADLEQIQELRRGFFLARWLMKDFVRKV